MAPRAWLASVTFSDGTLLPLTADSVVLLVGPNNAGKSATLRAVRDKLRDADTSSPVVDSISLGKDGTQDEVIAWLTEFTHKRLDPPQNPQFHALGVGLHSSDAIRSWGRTDNALNQLSRFFCHLLTADERLQAANPAGNIAIVRDPPTHPVHYVFRDDRIEAALSSAFRKAFGVDLVVHRNAGNNIPLHVGERPVPASGQDRVSFDYLEAIEKLPALHTQGDGMRSFAGVLLYTSVGRESLLLIDEPEAFLHPPQARLLGRMLVGAAAGKRQLVVATHSGDVLRGALDAGSDFVSIVRLQRDGAVNRVRHLDKESITTLWNDPLLRYSNVLDGVFHEKVIVCESDADARFYSAIADVVAPPASEGPRPVDVMFTHTGGKDRLPMVVRALRAVAVPTTAVADFDILRDEQPLRDLVESSGGNWAALAPDWNTVRASIEQRRPELSRDEVVKTIQETLAGTAGPQFPDDAKRAIQRVFKQATPWATAKTAGKSYVPNGQASQAFERLNASLRAIGIAVVELGELESFVRSVGNHGPRWVNEALKRDLANDPELEPARTFVRYLVAHP